MSTAISQHASAPLTVAGLRCAGGPAGCIPRRPSCGLRLLAPQSSLNRRDLLGAATVSTTLINTPSSLAASALPSSSSSSSATIAAASAAAPAITTAPLPTEVDVNGVTRLQLRPEGWNSWKWRSHNINWLSSGENSGPVVLLIHGFGASVYHYRYIVPELSKHCRVFALDVLGFGWSDKALVDYEGYDIWAEQISDFIREVVQPAVGEHEKVVLVGNSMGGYNSLSTAAANPSLVKGVVLLNAAGRFDEAQEGDEEAAPAAAAAAAAANQSFLQKITTQVSTAIKRAVVTASFVYTKQPARIKQVLGQVYVDKKNIDDDLVQSILIPAQDPAASEVFFRVITARGKPLNRLLARLEDARMPLLLLWGSRDPWCVPARATQIQQNYPRAERIDIEAGHCPHDDCPDLVLPPLLEWTKGLDA